MNHHTPLTAIVLVSLIAPAQARISDEAQDFINLMRESVQVRTKYVDVITDVVKRRTTPSDAAHTVNRMARRMERINEKTDYILDSLREDEKWEFKEVFESSKLGPKLRLVDQLMNIVKIRLAQSNYMNSSSLRDACRRYDRACRHSYLGL